MKTKPQTSSFNLNKSQLCNEFGVPGDLSQPQTCWLGDAYSHETNNVRKKRAFNQKKVSKFLKKSRAEIDGSQIYHSTHLLHCSYNACDCCVSNSCIDTRVPF